MFLIITRGPSIVSDAQIFERRRQCVWTGGEEGRENGVSREISEFIVQGHQWQLLVTLPC